MNCYSGHHSRLGTAKDERDNQVTAHEPAGKVKVSLLQNKVDAADAVDVEQNAETKIIKRKWRDLCQKFGHYLDQCPNQTGTILTQVGVSMTQRSAGIKDTWVLLDTCATNSVSNNTALVKDVVACKQHERLTVSTNGGLISFDKKSTLKILPMKVHFRKKIYGYHSVFQGGCRYPGSEDHHGHRKIKSNDSIPR